MHHKDFDLLSRALAGEHQGAEDSGRRGAIEQVEGVALSIAFAISREHRTFDPVKFMLAACDVTEFGQLAPATRAGMDRWFGVTTPRPRLNTARPSGLKPDEEIRTDHWRADIGIEFVLGQVSDSQGVSAAEGHLMNAGVRTLGQLVAMSDEQVRAVPGLRAGPVTMAAIHKVQELWRAKQPPDSGVVEVEPSVAGLTARVRQLDHPGASPATRPVPGPGGPGRTRGRSTQQPRPGQPLAGPHRVIQ